ncbi:flagellar hook-length control protein FliK [Natranaerovirga pectinivora]|uniref:Flagellar hook-length control protein FliK n=1 Tax=Natranaerovirga pectinivora TaxID=682400 RepID=A0A4R3MQB2_9FIRM|nr:flagellar hook-length control protein FliK [Natranaerovirga pectinivora]TCT16984.1 flagellar hook-length control protein FliK [Natranaerovirga pectinivora]
MRIGIGVGKHEPPVEHGKVQLKVGDVRGFNVGDVFEGEIKDIRHNLMVIRLLASNQLVMAKFSEQIEVNIGDSFLFQVKDKMGDQLVIRPYVEEDLSPKDQKVMRAIEEAELPVNDKNINLVKSLIDAGQPINKSSLHKFKQLSIIHKDFPVQDIIFLEKHNLPITKANMEQFGHYKGDEHSIVDQFDGLMVSIENKFVHLATEGTSQQLMDFHLTLQEGLNNFPEFESGFSNNLSQEQAEIVYNILKGVTEFNIEKDSFLGKSSKEIFEIINKLPMEKQEEVILKAFNERVYEPLLKDVILDKLFIKPEEVKKDNLVGYYKGLESLLESTVVNTSNEPNHQTLESLKDNLDFMKDLNQIVNYIQIPLKFKNQNVHSDLYVYKNPNKSKRDGKNISMLLRLDLAYLGRLDVFMDKKDKTINSQFFIEKEKTKTLLNDNMIHLVTALRDKGYILNPQIVNKSSEFSFPKDCIMEDVKSTNHLQRFSFDIRV